MNKQTRQGCTTQSINLGDLVKKPEVLPDDSKIKNIGSICSIRKVTPVELVEDNKLSDEQLENLKKLKKAQEYNDIIKGAKLGLSAYQKPNDGIPKVDLSLDLQLTLDEIDIIKEESKSSKAFGSVSYNEVTNKIYFYSVNDIELNSPVGVVKLPKFSKSTGGGALADWNATVGGGVILNKPDIYTKVEIDNIVNNLSTITILYITDEFGNHGDYIAYKENPDISEELPELYSNEELFTLLKNAKDCNIVVHWLGYKYLYLNGSILYYEEEYDEGLYYREATANFKNDLNGIEYTLEVNAAYDSDGDQYFVNYYTENHKIAPKNIFYGSCYTSAISKSITVDSDFLYATNGAIINIYFLYGLGSTQQLNINNTGLRYIYYKYGVISNPSTMVQAGDTATFMLRDNKYYLLNVDTHVTIEPLYSTATPSGVAYYCTSLKTYKLLNPSSSVVSGVTIYTPGTSSTSTYGAATTILFDASVLTKLIGKTVSFNSTLIWENSQTPPWDLFGVTINYIVVTIYHGKYASFIAYGAPAEEEIDAVVDVVTEEDGTLSFIKGTGDSVTVDLNHTHPLYVNRSSLSNVAFSGSYNDLADIPSFLTVTEQEKNTWNSKADKILLVNVESTGDVSLLLDPNKFYKFGSIDSLSITLSPSLDFYIYAGKFTTSNNWGGDGFNLSSSITRSPISDEIVAEQSYEFSIFDNVCIVKLID